MDFLDKVAHSRAFECVESVALSVALFVVLISAAAFVLGSIGWAARLALRLVGIPVG